MLRDYMNMMLDDQGATLLEYAVVITMVALPAVAALQYFLKHLTPSYVKAANQMQ